MEPYIETYSGRNFYFLEPKIEDIDIEDIAHSLAMQCRYCGHSKVFYSVAEHSIAVAHILQQKYNDRKLAFAGLLHDASEAYLSDIASPVKQYLPEYSKIEEGIQNVIAEKWGLDFNDTRIKDADIQMLSTEAWDLLPSKGEGWGWEGNWGGRPKRVEPVMGLPPFVVKGLFLDWFKQLSLEPQILLASNG